MLWTFGALASLGIVAGLRLRAPAMLAITAAIVLTGAIAGPLLGHGWLGTVGWVLLAAAVFQLAYLLGAALAVLLTRGRLGDGEK